MPIGEHPSVKRKKPRLSLIKILADELGYAVVDTIKHVTGRGGARLFFKLRRDGKTSPFMSTRQAYDILYPEYMAQLGDPHEEPEPEEDERSDMTADGGRIKIVEHNEPIRLRYDRDEGWISVDDQTMIAKRIKAILDWETSIHGTLVDIHKEMQQQTHLLRELVYEWRAK